MPIIPPDRLDNRLIKMWYSVDDQLHAPVLKWIHNSGAKPHLETFCNRLIAKASEEAIKAEVPKRTLYVKVSINLKKAANLFWSNMGPGLQKGINPLFIQTAIEMLLEEAEYSVVDHTFTHELHIPAIQELEAAAEQRKLEAQQREIEAARQRALLERAEEVEEDEDGDDDEDLDGDLDEEDEESEEEDLEEIAEDSHEEEILEESPVQVGAVFSNGKGIHRRIDGIEGGKVAYTVVQGSGRVKEGQTGSVAYKSFLSWAKEIVAAAA